MKTNGGREYKVEGHGASILVVRGGGLASWGHHRQPLLTRREAWDAARELMADGRYHTIKVLCGGEVVWRAFRQEDGSYINADTREAVRAA